jgi:hypothetical protein
MITYEYTVDGAHYRGQRYLWYRRSMSGMFDVGHKLPVYYDPKHPNDSYGPNRPLISPLIIAGSLGILAGGGIMLTSRLS